MVKAKKTKIPFVRRSPVVVVLGHVDHGKTSLLDYIRKSRVAAREHGGITQKIGAYEIDIKSKDFEDSRITFIDTPGHEAFSKLRARGSQIADIAILVVDAKDSLMPQTIESIAHIKVAGIPYIVVLNKCDLPNTNPEQVYRDLLKHDVQVDKKGGTIHSLLVSAKTGQGVADLLMTLLLIAEENASMLQPGANKQAVVVEVNKDKRGVVLTVISIGQDIHVQDTLYDIRGNKIKVRALISDTGVGLRTLKSSTPALLLGAQEQPDVGSMLSDIAPAQSEAVATDPLKKPEQIDMSTFFGTNTTEKRLQLVLKVDSGGSLEALTSALEGIESIVTVYAGVGEISQSDIFLAKTTGAIVVGYGVHANNLVAQIAQQEKVIVKTFDIIYELLTELEEVSGLIQEREEAKKSLKAEARVQATFMIEGEKIFGLKVIKGKIILGDEIRAVRSGNVLGKSKIVSMKVRAKSVKEVKKDEECGVVLSPSLDIRAGDVIQSGL